jgi:hypothetical protein
MGTIEQPGVMKRSRAPHDHHATSRLPDHRGRAPTAVLGGRESSRCSSAWHHPALRAGTTLLALVRALAPQG